MNPTLTQTENGTRITLDGITYLVLKLETAETAAANGHAGTANLLREQNAEFLYLKRPNGNKTYFAKRSFHPVLKEYFYSSVSVFF
jgi:hypothetical protein